MSVNKIIRPLGIGAAAIFGGGLAITGWAAGIERRRFVLRNYQIPALPAGSEPLRILHLADFHLAPGQRKKIRFVRQIADLAPDLVVLTGDNYGHRDAFSELVEILAPFRDVPGISVFGSNDYYEPVLKNPLTYVFPGERKPATQPKLNTDELRWLLFDQFGWHDLTNTAVEVTAAGHRIRAIGVDDPHIKRDRLATALEHFTELPAHPTDIVLGLVHAPYQRILDAYAGLDGMALMLAGHTHGGQVCLPGGRAIVSNCDLPPEYAGGLNDWRGVPLHVSRGLGTSIYAPVRTFCAPEASLITLQAQDAI